MASSDYDRPVSEQPVDSTQPPNPNEMRTAWTGPVGIVLAIVVGAVLMVFLLG